MKPHTTSEQPRHSTTRLKTLIVIALASLTFHAPVGATAQEAAKLYEDALGRYEKNDVAGAIIQLKNALQQDKNMLAAHLLLGKALLKNGDLKSAEAAFEEALRQGVNRGEVALPLGQIYLALGRPEAVIEQIQASELPKKLQVEVLTMRGNAYVEAGNTRLASKTFEDARLLDPAAAGPLIAEVPMLLGAGQLALARERAEKAVELAPEDAFAWNAKASVLHAAFDMPGALAAYDKALSIYPRHVDARVARAGLFIDLKREDGARKDLEFLLPIAPDEPRAAYLRALLASQKGDEKAIAAALADVTRTIDALPPAWLARRESLLMAGALAHHGLANLEKARGYLDVLISRNPRNVGAKKLLASIYVDTKDFARALPLLETLLKQMPDDPQVMFLLGSVHMAQHRYLQASELLERAAAMTGSAEMNRTLAFSQLGLGRNDIGQISLEKAFAKQPGDTRTGTALAMLYMRQAKTREAQQVAEAMLAADPSNLTIMNFVGSIKGATGDKVGARATYTEVLAKDVSFRPATLNLVRLDVGDKRYDDARIRLDQMLRANHDDADALFEYGSLEQKAGRTTEAVRHLRKASEIQRNDPRPSLALIDLYLFQRQGDQALSVAKDLASKLPDNLSVQIALARTYLSQGLPGDARSVLNTATRLADYDARVQVIVARMQLAAGNVDGAGYSVLKALQGSPDDLAALALAVEVEARRGDPSKADTALRVLSKKYPDRPETAMTTANLAMSRSQFPAAIAAYRAALAREESTGLALALAQAHIAAGEVTKAASFLEGWMKKHPADRPAQKALAEAQFRAGLLAAARENYAKVIETHPDDASTLNNYANLLLQIKDPKALEVAQRAVALSPENSAYADTLGWILVQKGDIETGLRYLREARLRNPEIAEIRLHLAHALAKIGRVEEAKAELSAALANRGKLPDDPVTTQLKNELGMP